MKRLFSFDGRIDRAGFWLTVIASVVVLQVLPAGVLLVLVFLSSVGTSSILNVLTGVLGFYGIYAALLILSIWVTTAAAVKRLHDRGKTGWWAVVLWIGPLVLFVSTAVLTGNAGPIVLGASLVLFIWGFVELGCLPGTTGSNSYGPDPRLPKPA